MYLKTIFASTMFGIALVAPAKAQVVLNMSQITCGQFLSAEAGRQAFIGSWMGGYYSATKNLNMLELRYVKRNTKVVGRYCKNHKSEKFMNAIQKNWR